MGAAQRLCYRMIDVVDTAIATAQQADKQGARPVLALGRADGPQTVQFVENKNRLLGAMRDAFIEPRTKSLKLSALLTFCYQNGVVLVTQKVTLGAQACFQLRTPGFDLIVESV